MRDLRFWSVKVDRLSIPCGDCASDIVDYHYPECSIHKTAK